MDSLKRLLRPKSIAMIGGKEAERSIIQCDRLGYDGTIWPVHPTRDSIQGRKCLSSVEQLPVAPDAAFVAIPGAATVETIEYLASIGTAGAVSYASGFAELGGHGAALQRRLERSLGSMALIGPNCYGMLNYLDGIALWPDEQGGQRSRRGIAIISQSGNISINLTMQRRGVPLAFVISAGNMAGIKTHEFVRCMLEDDRVTAIGLYLEGICDAYELSKAATDSLRQGKPIVVLEAGRSEIGSKVALSHSSSMTGQGQISSAFFKKYGMLQVNTIPEFLETLKLLSINGTVKSNSIATVSCSGGEAAIMADHAEMLGLEFSEFTDSQVAKLSEVLGDRVSISNPLDYHTYIWGMPHKQENCFRSVFEGRQALTVMAIDYPSEGFYNADEWSDTIKAVIDARKETRAEVVVMASMHENMPQPIQLWLSEQDIAPMLGMDECFKAILNAAAFHERRTQLNEVGPLIRHERVNGSIVTLTEHDAKQELARYGLSVVEGAEVEDEDHAVAASKKMGFPVALKASSSKIIHKTDSGAVRLNLDSERAVRSAFVEIRRMSRKALVEKMMPKPHAELLVGVRYDTRFGLIMILGSGGTLTELISDFAVIFFPLNDAAIDDALSKIKAGKLLKEFRGSSGDIEAARNTISAIAAYAMENSDNLVEIEVNPLHVYEQGSGTVVIDALIRKIQDKQ